MDGVTRFWKRLWMLLRRGEFRRGLEEEMAFHQEQAEKDFVAEGMTPETARHAARRQFGNATRLKEQSHETVAFWLEGMAQDVWFAARQMRKNPGFACTAILVLALGIGANTAIFSVAKQLLYDRLAVPDAAQLRLLSWTGTAEHVAVHDIWGDYDPLSGGRVTSTAFSYAAFQQLRAENHVLEDMFAFKRIDANATIRGSAQRIRGELVSGNYYADLGVRPVLGRSILPGDDAKPGQGAVAVISYGLWKREFNRSPQVLGQVIQVNDTPLTIIGVNPREFTSAEDAQTPVDVFIPLSMQPLVWPQPGKTAPLFDATLWWVNIMGRAKADVSEAMAQSVLNAQLAAIVRGTMPVRPDDDLPRMELRDGSRGLFEQRRIFAQPMSVLMTLVGFVLLLACVNLANLMLARGAHRQREMSVRLALGAGRGRILRQMLVESLMLAALGGTCGLLAAYVARNAIPKLLENSWGRTSPYVSFDWSVIGFTVAITFLTAILFGLAPALTAARAEVSYGLKEGAASATRHHKGLGGRALVTFQIALSTLLVIAAGLSLRTLAGLNSVDVGFRTDHLLLFEVSPPRIRYPPGKDIQLHRRLEAAFAAVPGVKSVTAAQLVYITDLWMRQGFLPEGQQHGRGQAEYYNVVGNHFFETLGIPIVAGRSFGPQDTATSLKVGIINQSLARTGFANQNPIGKRFSMSILKSDGDFGRETVQIVGICADTRYASLRAEPPPQFFLPFVQQNEVGTMDYEIRTTMKPGAIVPALRHVTQQIDPNLPLGDVRTQKQQIEAATQQERLFVVLTSGFGLLALTLACVGIYGIMAYSVARRTNEIGIRLALGAQPAQVRRMILREGAWVTAGGVLIGLGAAVFLAHLVRSMLYGITSYDSLTLCVCVALLFAVALVASWIPSRRAASIDPMQALRAE